MKTFATGLSERLFSECQAIEDRIREELDRGKQAVDDTLQTAAP